MYIYKYPPISNHNVLPILILDLEADCVLSIIEASN